jgi:TonB family protein
MIKNLMSVLGVALVVSGLYISTVGAQEPAPTMIRGGVLNGKAIKLPKPAYPEAAKLERVGGPVSVTVTIDEEGNVIEAKAAEEYKRPGDSDGEGMLTVPVHPALREAAEQAAMEAKFSPTKLSGVPVKVRGVITYNFVPGEPETLFKGPESGVGNAAVEIKPRSRAVSGGVLNGRATHLPAPVYPSLPNDVRGVGGAVSVQVLIDENGVVTSANAVSGHPLLRAAAVEAAKQAQFSPTVLSGQPVKVQGVLTYNFVPKGENN